MMRFGIFGVIIASKIKFNLMPVKNRKIMKLNICQSFCLLIFHSLPMIGKKLKGEKIYKHETNGAKSVSGIVSPANRLTGG